VQTLSGTTVPVNRPFIGEGAYTIESGIVTGWYRQAFEKNPTTVFPVHPKFVGHEAPKIVMGKKSGTDNIEIWKKKLGLSLSDEEGMAVLQEVKLKSHDLKRTLTEEEFKSVVAKVTAKKK
jgi:isopropylmalate/homocitrate/citramalate synthase